MLANLYLKLYIYIYKFTEGSSAHTMNMGYTWYMQNKFDDILITQ